MIRLQQPRDNPGVVTSELRLNISFRKVGSFSMGKAEQQAINTHIVPIWEEALASPPTDYFYVTRLNKSQACIYQKGNLVLLLSYDTFVALYNIDKNTVYDMLRYEYGFTGTSAQHISKFKTYCYMNFCVRKNKGYPVTYRYYPV